MRILMLGPDRSVHGGISGVVNNYYEAGLDKKIELYYIGTMKEGSKVKKLIVAVGAYIRFLCKLSWCDIVHVNFSSDSSFIRKSFFIRRAHKVGKKIVLHQHGGDFTTFYNNQLNEKGKQNVKNVLGMGDIMLVLAPMWKEFFETIVPNEEIVVFPDSIMIPEERKKEYGQHKILFLGRLCREKGIGELISILPNLRERFPNVKLILGGIWEDKELKAEADKFPDSIIQVGWVTGNQKSKLLGDCDIFVLPSYFEGQSVSLLEAMAHSCACVASDTGGIPLMIQDGYNGILVCPKDKDSLTEGLLKLLESDMICSQLGEMARKTAVDEYSINNNIQKLIDIYNKLISNNYGAS